MKKLAALLMVLSLGLVMVGCEASTEVDTAPPPAVDTGPDAGMDTDVDAGVDTDAGFDADAGPADDDAGIDVEVDNP